MDILLKRFEEFEVSIVSLRPILSDHMYQDGIHGEIDAMNGTLAASQKEKLDTINTWIDNHESSKIETAMIDCDGLCVGCFKRGRDCSHC